MRVVVEVEVDVEVEFEAVLAVESEYKARTDLGDERWHYGYEVQGGAGK